MNTLTFHSALDNAVLVFTVHRDIGLQITIENPNPKEANFRIGKDDVASLIKFLRINDLP